MGQLLADPVAEARHLIWYAEPGREQPGGE